MPGNRSDYGTEQTDRAVKRVERRLSSVYREAQRDIDDKLKDWQERHKKRDARYRQMVAAGKMSKEDYRAWVRGQVFQEKQWQARRDEIDNILLNADRAAQNIVNEGKLGVFAANANYMGYALERDSNIDTGFVLYSEGTVARLIEDDPQILPKPAPGVQKDLAFPYYNKLMSSAITQGIVQGETISEIAGRVARTTGESSYKSAMRNARTAYTGAQNAGRIEGLHQAQRLGIKVKKKWLAILDSRTRDAHANLDGQIQEVDDPFKSDLGEIMFPGDPTAKPGNVYNCRCTLTYEYPDYPSTMPRRDAENGQIVADMTYREWEALKKGEGKAPSSEREYEKPVGTFDRIAHDTGIEQLENVLGDAYNYHMDKYGAELVRYEDGAEMSPVVVNLDGMDEDGQRLFIDTVGAYCKKYDTSLQDIHVMSASERAAIPNGVIAVTSPNAITNTSEMTLNPVYCSDFKRMLDVIDKNIADGFFADVPQDKRPAYIFTHEFGHTLITMGTGYNDRNNPLNVDYKKIKQIQRRVTAVYDEYRNAGGNIEQATREVNKRFEETFDMDLYEKGKQLNRQLRQTKISTYSLTNADEFFAEAFTYTELGGDDNIYATKVREIIDDVFRR